MTLLVAVLAVAVAYVVKGVVGFGSVLVSMPVLIWVLPPADAVLVVTSADLVGGGVLAWGARREVPWRVVALLLVPLLALQWVGTELLAVLDVRVVRRVLAVLVGTMALALLRRPVRPAGWVRPDGGLGAVALATAGLAGAVAGLCSGLVGAPGPPIVAWVRRFVDDLPGRAAMLWVFFVSSTSLVVILLADHKADAARLGLAAACVPAAVGGGFVGGQVARRISPATFGRAVALVLTAAALGLAVG
ncbi:MAG: TSUP family transporter [Alphaproteobacteria bacterium]|nr:TSUP family transporter [Alphaproteobacteria bacterium]